MVKAGPSFQDTLPKVYFPHLLFQFLFLCLIIFLQFSLKSAKSLKNTMYDHIKWGAPLAQSVERWTCDSKVAGSNPGFEGQCGTISI